MSAVLHAALVGAVLYLSGVVASTPRPVAVNRTAIFLVFSPVVPVVLDPPTPRLQLPRPVELERSARAERIEPLERVNPPERVDPTERLKPTERLDPPERVDPAERLDRTERLKPPERLKPVTVGAFQPSASRVNAPETAREIRPTGFEPPTAQAPAITLAGPKVGAFDVASGSVEPKPGTDRPSRGVAAAGFGAPAPAPPAVSRAPGGVSDAGFGSGSAQGRASANAPGAAVHESGFDAKAAPQKPVLSAPSQRIDLPVEVLFKPAPQYTDEARVLKLEGDVLLEVEFTATSQVRVLRVVRGLGHGLDEAAVRAAEQIRFKPARAAGLQVDFRTTVHIVFRLT